jgi:hypothetical protein
MQVGPQAARGARSVRLYGVIGTIDDTLAVSTPKPIKPSTFAATRIGVDIATMSPNARVVSVCAEKYVAVSRRWDEGGGCAVLVRNPSGTAP